MRYTVFNKATGRIERVVSCPADMIDLQYDHVTCDRLEGEYADDSFYVVDSHPVEIPSSPSAHHIFNYTTKQWVDPRTPETEWPLVRAKRNQLLQQSDWTQLPDVPLTTKESWAIYRQQLRDVTNQTDPFNIVWPTAPN